MGLLFIFMGIRDGVEMGRVCRAGGLVDVVAVVWRVERQAAGRARMCVKILNKVSILFKFSFVCCYDIINHLTYNLFLPILCLQSVTKEITISKLHLPIIKCFTISV